MSRPTTMDELYKLRERDAAAFKVAVYDRAEESLLPLYDSDRLVEAVRRWERDARRQSAYDCYLDWLLAEGCNSPAEALGWLDEPGGPVRLACEAWDDEWLHPDANTRHGIAAVLASQTLRRALEALAEEE